MKKLKEILHYIIGFFIFILLVILHLLFSLPNELINKISFKKTKFFDLLKKGNTIYILLPIAILKERYYYFKYHYIRKRNEK